jgi:acetyl esterase/lipase
MLWIGAVLVLLGLLAALPLTSDRIPARASFYLFAISVTGQIWSFPLAIVAGVLAVLASETSAWVMAVAACLFAFAHARNRLAGRLLLDAAGLTQIKVPLLAGLVPLLPGGGKVRRIKDLTYGEHGERNRLDIVVASEPGSAPMPILIHVHGGGWASGGKGQQARPLLHHLAEHGWLCFDLNYRLGPADRMPAMIVDVLKAIAWVRSHAAEYGGDPARIAISGGSAGGHLAVLAALAHDDRSFKPDFEDADCSVARVVPVYGVFDLLDRNKASGRNHSAVSGYMADQIMPCSVEACPDLWHALSPLDRVRADAPPMFIIHGTGDSLQPFRNARTFAQALQSTAQAPVTLVELPGIEHAYDMAGTALVWAHVRAIEAFLEPLAHGSE